jgi:hypothetical protein
MIPRLRSNAAESSDLDGCDFAGFDEAEHGGAADGQCPRSVFHAEQLSGLNVPESLMEWLRTHDEEQDDERLTAGDLWHEDGWMFTQPTGKPLDPRADHDEWKSLLEAAGVRDARLHDARHTAATMLLVLNVPLRAIADVMGWSPGSAAQMAGRYMHVPDAIREGIARQVGGLLWTEADDDASDLTEEHRAAIRQLAEALPPRWRERLAEVFPDDAGGTAGVPVPA